jgi:hypothetical protein
MAWQAPAAQKPAAPLRIFLDCYDCDLDYLRQHVVFIDYMRDRTDADLHVLVTTQGTGSGGRSWTVKFIGLGRFQSEDRTVVFSTPQTATSDDRRKEFARQLRLGLAGYAADTAVAHELDLTFRPPAAGPASPAATVDPWSAWVFSVSGSANLSGEASRSGQSYRMSFSGRRVTEKLKMSFNVSGSESRSSFLLSDGRKVDTTSDSWGTGGTIVKSMGPRFSIGVRLNAGHSSFSNEDRSVSIYPGFEFNLFPYSDFERRSFTIWYEAGPNFYKYRELTVFDRLEETVPRHQMDVSLRFRQPWGSMNAFWGTSQDLQHLERYRSSLSGGADVRLFKGFSFNVYASHAKIKNQISLPKAGATQEEVLLRLRQLATNYSYSFNVGFTYSFGSIFTSVVNPRFGGTGGFFFQ